MGSSKFVSCSAVVLMVAVAMVTGAPPGDSDPTPEQVAACAQTRSDVDGLAKAYDNNFYDIGDAWIRGAYKYDKPFHNFDIENYNVDAEDHPKTIACFEGRMESWFDFLDIIANDQPNKEAQFASKWSPIPGCESDQKLPAFPVESGLKSADDMAASKNFEYDRDAYRTCFGLYARYRLKR